MRRMLKLRNIVECEKILKKSKNILKVALISGHTKNSIKYIPYLVHH